MKTHRRLRAEAIEIVDSRGAVRMVMAVDDGCPIIELFDDSGNLRATLYVGKAGEPGLAFSRGTQAVDLLMYVDRMGCPQLRMRQHEMENHIVLACIPTPSLILNDGLRELVVTPPKGTVDAKLQPPMEGDAGSGLR